MTSFTPNPAYCTLAILAGGRGSRMGVPKDRLVIGGRPILLHLLHQLAFAGPKLLIVSPERPTPVGVEAFDRLAMDDVTGEGPLAGILAGLRMATTSAVCFLSVDMPGVGREQLAWLAKQIQNGRDLTPSPGTPGEGRGGGSRDAYWGNGVEGYGGSQLSLPKAASGAGTRPLHLSTSPLRDAFEEPPPQPSPGVPGEGANANADVDRCSLGIFSSRLLGTEYSVEPFPCVIQTAAYALIAAHFASGRRSMHSLLDVPGFVVRPSPGSWDESVWLNLNRPEDLRQIGAKLG